MTIRRLLVVLLLVLLVIAAALLGMAASASSLRSGARRSVAGGAERWDGRPPIDSGFPFWMVEASRKDDRVVDYSLFRTVAESRYSSLTPEAAPQVINIMREHLGHDLGGADALCDLTAHVGADLANFSRAFPALRLTAVEIDDGAFAALRENVGRIGFADRAALHNASALDYLGMGDDALAAVAATCPGRDGGFAGSTAGTGTIFYADPPWGGPDYVDKKDLMLFLGGRPIHEIVARALACGGRSFVLKVPVNFAMDAFRGGVAGGGFRVSVAPVRKVRRRPKRRARALAGAAGDAGAEGDVAFRIVVVQNVGEK